MPVHKKSTSRKVKAGTTKKKGVKKTVKSKEDNVMYPEISTEICIGDDAITAERAKEMLGWREETEGEDFGSEYLLKYKGKKVRCDNNISNRFFYNSVAEVLKQEHLRGRWRFNGEPIIISRTGMIHNGQHTLISIIKAADEWHDNPDAFPDLEREPVLEKLVVYGIDDDDEVVNTLDSGKGRSTADVIGRLPYFKDMKSQKDRKTCSRITEHAIKMLWHRMGDHKAFSFKRTHAETVDYLERHPRIVDAVRHIHTENDGNKISRYVSPGYASALLYLMATSDSDPEPYYKADSPDESLLNFDKWDQACEFFVELASGSKTLEPVRRQLKKLMSEEMVVIAVERVALLVKAWAPYSEGSPVEEEDITLEYEVIDDKRELTETPLVGGIDVGKDGLHFPASDDPDPEEIEERASKVRKKKVPKKRKAKRAGGTWDKGDIAWVHEEGGEAYLATITEEPLVCNDGIERVMVEAEDGDWEVKTEQLSLKQFEMVS